VLDADGDVVPPGIIGPMLLDAKEQGILKVALVVNVMMMTGACESPTEHLAVSGLGAAPFVQRLDLRQQF
jgi:hypothetical protein